jgi:redox-sensitive bicupin YhaK (pirin superfamily)
MKKVISIRRSEGTHWVGDGFPVQTIFSYNDRAQELSPFLMMDYGGPQHFPPTTKKRGVGEHPHRGFETVTIVYSGEVEHRDSAGGGGKIGPGDVQWMTAASGLVHEEFHGAEFAAKGGALEMIQLWVNLPARDKGAPPRYQGITKTQIPSVNLTHHAGTLRVIAGEFEGHVGPARTFSPINLWDVHSKKGSTTTFQVAADFTASIFILKGQLKLSETQTLGAAELAVFETAGTEIQFESLEDTTFLLLNGKPLNEPIVGYGPFVMNTNEEIKQAFEDYQSGRMGRLVPR